MSHSRSNFHIFTVPGTGSPVFDNLNHISGLGHVRIDFERFKVTENAIFSIEGDWAPTSQQDEEARIGSLAHALDQLGSKEDAAVFVRCLNKICEEGDARSRQVTASYYYQLAKDIGVGQALKNMGLIAMGLSSLQATTEEVESECEIFYVPPKESRPRPLFELSSQNFPSDAADILAQRFEGTPANVQNHIIGKMLFDQEVNSIKRMIRGRRRAAGFAHDDWAEWLSDLDTGGATLEELDDAYRFLEAQQQYDEGGAVIHMSEHERPVTRGRLDHEYTAEDLPLEARHLAGYLLRAYVTGVDIEETWGEIDKEIYRLFPIHQGIDGPEGPRRTNLTRGYPDCRLSREEIRAMDPNVVEVEGGELKGDSHLASLRNNAAYRRFFMGIRCATETGRIAEVMNKACLAHKSGEISPEELRRLQKEKDIQNRRLLTSNVVTYGRPNFISHPNREIQQHIQDVLEALLSEWEEDFHLKGMRKNKVYRDFHTQLRRATTQVEVSNIMKQAYEARTERRVPLKLFVGLRSTAAKQRERLRSKPVGKEAYKLIEDILTADEKGLKRISWEIYGQNRPSHSYHKMREHEQSLVWDVLNIKKTVRALWGLPHALLLANGNQCPGYVMLMAAIKEFLEEPYLRNTIRAALNKQPSPQKNTSSPKRDSSTSRRPAAPAKRCGFHSTAISNAPPA